MELEKELNEEKRRRFPRWVFPTVTFGVIFLLLEQGVDFFKSSTCGFGDTDFINKLTKTNYYSHVYSKSHIT